MRTLRTSLTLLLLIAGFCTVVAQEQPVADTAKQQDILKLLRLSGSAELGLQAMDQIMMSFEEMFPDVPAGFWADFRNEAKAEDLLDMMVPIYDKYYTHDDIRDLIKFYESPIGQKMIETMPLVLQESMQAGQEWGRALSEKMLQKLKEKGYSKM
jgi:hypothetical protein